MEQNRSGFGPEKLGICSGSDTKGAANSGAVGPGIAPHDSELSFVLAQWPALSSETRERIVALVLADVQAKAAKGAPEAAVS
jgi:hypothetical protein